MGDISGEREWAEPRGALLNSAAAQTLPGPALPLVPANKNGDRRCTPAPIRSSDTERPESSCDMMLFGGIELLRPIFVGCGLPRLIIGEEFRQRSRFTPLLGRV